MNIYIMERFWNIIHYFVYRAVNRAAYYSYKFTGLPKVYDLPFMKKRFKKMGIKDPKAGLMNAWERHDIGLSIIYTGGLIIGAHGFFLMGLHILLLPGINITKVLFAIYVGAVLLLNYMLFEYKDKYMKYFKEFDKKPQKWKTKWKWISLGVMVFMYGFFFLAMIV